MIYVSLYLLIGFISAFLFYVIDIKKAAHNHKIYFHDVATNAKILFVFTLLLWPPMVPTRLLYMLIQSIKTLLETVDTKIVKTVEVKKLKIKESQHPDKVGRISQVE